MTFRELIESSSNTAVVIFHGDNFETTKIEPKWMFHSSSNNQEGIGIYFGTLLETAQAYGKNIVKAVINHKNFIDSRVDVRKIPKAKVIKMLEELNKIDNEELYYLMTDYGIDIREPEDVTKQDIIKLYNYLANEQVRNFQVLMCEKFGVENFVRLWNDIIKIDGTYQKQAKDNTWYAVINTNIKLEKL